MKIAKFTLVLTFLIVTAAVAQEVIQLPSLSITGTTLQSRVSYDSARHVYRYEYTIVAPATNRANVAGFSVDISGKSTHEQLDPDLHNNVRRYEESGMGIQPATTIPIGINVPDPNSSTSMVGMTARWGFQPKGAAAPEIQPGMTFGGIYLESKFPPGMREAVIHPSQSAWDVISFRYEGQGVTFEPETADQYELHLKVPAPSEPSDADLFAGGGQQPAEVNRFLRYAWPLENRVKVPAGTSSYTVIVYYGNAINPSTFSVTLNDVSISAQFQPIPGTAQVIEIPLTGSSTKLQLSVEGTKTPGRTARDTDTLTFLVQ